MAANMDNSQATPVEEGEWHQEERSDDDADEESAERAVQDDHAASGSLERDLSQILHEISQDPPSKRQRFGNEVQSMLDAFAKAGAELAARVPKTTTANDHQIVQQVRHLRQLAQDLLPQQPAQLQRIAAGALACYRTRLSELGLRDHVMFLHLIEGHDRIRAHNGCIFTYGDGSWDMFNGVVPEATLLRVKQYLLHLEGLFVMLADSKDHIDKDDKLMSTIKAIIDDLALNNASEVLATFSDKAIFRTSAGDEIATEGRMLTVAKNVSKLSVSLQRELLCKNIFTYYSEWCSTDRQPQAGACFKDACVIFDASGSISHVSKSPERNIYIFVAHTLTDPYEAEAMGRVQAFLSSTFVFNQGALKCQLAALALALHGVNVDRCFWTLGPGGVGQSLLTHHLNAVFPGLHTFVDTTIYYSDDELRKQADLMLGKVIHTGQEAVEGTGRPMREDLYKKHISADPVAARLPYGIITKLVELIGWKRMELNKIIKFVGVTDMSFNSIMRRSWVCCLKGKFVSKSVLDGIPDASERGIFLRDPSLKDFLKSGPAARATLAIIHGFLAENNKHACEKLIEDYVNGGDGGVTEKTMRFATGVKESTEANPATEGPFSHPAASFDPVAAETTALQSLSDELAALALEHDAESLTDLQIAKLAGDKLKGNNLSKRREAFMDLVSRGFWKEAATAWRAIRTYVPAIRTKGKVDKLFPGPTEPSHHHFFEVFDVQGLRRYANEFAFRAGNDDVMLDFWQRSESYHRGPGSGRRSAEASDQISAVVKQQEKMAAHGAALEKLLITLAAHEDDIALDGRLRQERTYQYKLPQRSRRYVAEAGAQSMSKRLRQQALREVCDWDLRNSMFTLVAQMVDKVEVLLPHPAAKMPTVRQYNQDRNSVIATVAGGVLSHAAAKSLLIGTFNGQKIPSNTPAKELLEKLRMEGRICRWLAATLMPDLLRSLADDKKTWPEASVFFHLYAGVEDYVLEAMADFALQKPVQHLSLHFDGIMLDTAAVQSRADFKTEAERFVEQATGYKVELTLKKHALFLDFLTQTCTAKSDVPLPPALLRDGNCILAALFRLSKTPALLQKEAGKKSATNALAASERCRSYRACQALLQCQLTPQVELDLKEGKYLLHFENGGRPHCIAILINASGECEVYDGLRLLRTSRASVLAAAEEAVDRATLVAFQFSDETSERDANLPETRLLDLQAGAAKQELRLLGKRKTNRPSRRSSTMKNSKAQTTTRKVVVKTMKAKRRKQVHQCFFCKKTGHNALTCTSKSAAKYHKALALVKLVQGKSKNHGPRRPQKTSPGSTGALRKERAMKYSGKTAAQKARAAKNARRRLPFESHSVEIAASADLAAFESLKDAGYIRPPARCPHCERGELFGPADRERPDSKKRSRLVGRPLHFRCEDPACRAWVNVLRCTPLPPDCSKSITVLQLHKLLQEYTRGAVRASHSPSSTSRTCRIAVNTVIRIFRFFRQKEAAAGRQETATTKLAGNLEVDATNIRKLRVGLRTQSFKKELEEWRQANPKAATPSHFVLHYRFAGITLRGRGKVLIVPLPAKLVANGGSPPPESAEEVRNSGLFALACAGSTVNADGAHAYKRALEHFPKLRFKNVVHSKGEFVRDDGSERLLGTQLLDQLWAQCKATVPNTLRTSLTSTIHGQAIDGVGQVTRHLNPAVMEYVFAWQWRRNLQVGGQDLYFHLASVLWV